MFTFSIVLITLIAIVMVFVILLQSGQGGGLAGIASGGAAQQVLGTRQSPDTLEKATWTLGTIFIMLCLLSNFLIQPEETGSVLQQGAQTPMEQQSPLPGAGDDAAPLPEGGGDAEPMSPSDNGGE